MTNSSKSMGNAKQLTRQLSKQSSRQLFELSDEDVQLLRSGEWYSGRLPQLVKRRMAVKQVLADYNRQPTLGQSKHVLNLFGQTGQGSFVEPRFHCDYGTNIQLGERVYINANCTFLDGGLIAIGDDVLIGPNSQLLAVTHPKDRNQRAEGLSLGRPIRIESGAWIGAGVSILPGVTIGEAAIIGAGALISKDVSAGVTVVGNH